MPIEKNIVLKITKEGTGQEAVIKGYEEMAESAKTFAFTNEQLMKQQQQDAEVQVKAAKARAASVKDLATAFGNLSKTIVGETASKALQDIAGGLKNIADLREKIAAKKKLLDTTEDIRQQKQLNAEVQTLEKLLGNLGNIGKENFDELGNALKPEKVITLRQELRKLREEIAKRQSTGEVSADLDALIDKAGNLDDALRDVTAQIKNTGSDTRNIEGAIQIFGSATGAVSALQGAQQLLGGTDEEFQRILLKLNALMLISNGIQQVQNALQHESAAITLITNAQRKAGILITQLQSAAESDYTVVRYAATAAQYLLNAAMRANPAGILLTAVTALAAAVLYFTRNTDDATEAQKQLNQELENAIDINNQFAEETKRRAEIQNEQLKLNGATDQQIREQNIKNVKKQLDEQQALEDRYTEAYNAAADRRRTVLNVGAKYTEEQSKEDNRTIDAYEKISQKKLDLQDEYDLLTVQNQLATQKEIEKFDEDAEKAREDAFKKDKENRDRRAKELAALAERDRKAKQEQIKLEIQDQISARDVILNDPDTAAGSKLAALQQSNSLQQELLEKQKDFDISNEKLTGEEKKAVVAKYLSDLDKLQVEYGKKEQAIRKESAEQDLRLTKETQEKRKQSILDNRGGQISELQRDIDDNEQRLKSEQLTADQQLAIRQDTANKKGRIARIENIQAGELRGIDVISYKEYEDQVTKAHKDGLDSRKELDEVAIKKQEDIINRRLSLETKGLDFISKGEDVFFANNQARDQADLQHNQDLYDRKLISEQEYQTRRNDITKRQAAAQKEKALFDIGIELAKSIFQVEAQAAVLAANPITAALAPAALRQIPVLITESIVSAAVVAARRYSKGKIRIDGPGTESSDSIPALLSKNESVINAEASRTHEQALRAINEHRFEQYLLQYELPRIMAKMPSAQPQADRGERLDYDKMGKAFAKHVKMPAGTSFHIDKNGIVTIARDGISREQLLNEKSNR